MKALIVAALFSAAKALAGELFTRIAALAIRAEHELNGKTGPEKKAWLIAELKGSKVWAASWLATQASSLASAVVDVIVADAKSRLASK